QGVGIGARTDRDQKADGMPPWIGLVSQIEDASPQDRGTDEGYDPSLWPSNQHIATATQNAANASRG
ncbi:MAG: hypothetical protein AAGB34_06795, partial [Planctomycetota bacterium]